MSTTVRRSRARPKGRTRLTAKNQVTISKAAVDAAGLHAGDTLRVESSGPGRIVLIREENVVDKYAGSMPGIWPEGWLEELRSEWDR